MTNIQVEDLSAVRKKLTFEVPQDRVSQTLEAQFKDLKRNAQIKGFRRGKVPMEILKNLFKEQVESDAAKKIIEETFELGLDEKKIKPISVVHLDQNPIEEGKPFIYTVEIEAPPELDVKGYKGLSLEKTVRNVSEKEVDERLEAVRQQHSRLVPITEDRAVKDGDHLVVDIEAVADGEAVKSLTVKDYHLEIGRNFYLPDFDSKITGLKIGDQVTITHELAADFPRKELAGKPVTFAIDVKEAKEKVVPELDDDLAKELGEFESLDDLRKQVSEDMQLAYDNENNQQLRKQITEKIIEENPFEAPESMVEARIDDIVMSARENLARQGIDMKRFPMPDKTQRDSIRPRALENVKAALIIKAIGEREEIQVTPEEIDSEIEKRAKIFGWTADYLRDQLEENQTMDNFTSALLEDKIYTFIENQSDITEKPYSEPEAESVE